MNTALIIKIGPSVEHESKNTVENVGLFELSPFSKYEIKGEKAYEELQRLCTANIKNEIGKCTYTICLMKMLELKLI